MSETEDATVGLDDVTPLDFLRAVYCNEGIPLPVRMRAAIACLPFVHPKLSASYAVSGERNFAAEMKEISRRSERSNVLDSKANYAIEASPVPQLDDRGEMPKPPGFRRRM